MKEKQQFKKVHIPFLDNYPSSRLAQGISKPYLITECIDCGRYV